MARIRLECRGPSPRVRGSRPRASVAPGRVRGPSPRVRGSHHAPDVASAATGSIPACAGKPPGSSRFRLGSRVHPRVCGEAVARIRITGAEQGPSPRVRGSPHQVGRGVGRHGSIPACAGKPRLPVQMGGSPQGPSPRVRGSLHAFLPSRYAPGSIPACAGKPSVVRSRDPTSRVHPRVCGEAGRAAWTGPCRRGPSPRVRGSRHAAQGRHHHRGSIPACAGKPSSRWRRWRAGTVHPRVCGEAGDAPWPEYLARGPSPRVRGSRAGPPSGAGLGGSIPACAGKPRAEDLVRPARQVHPRVCGEAGRFRRRRGRGRGPSPRVRGSRAPFVGFGIRLGSIPACAGKPRSRKWT